MTKSSPTVSQASGLHGFKQLVNVEPILRAIQGRDGGCSLLVYGRDGVGKLETVRALIARLFCENGNGCGSCGSCHEAAAGLHPEVVWFDGQVSFNVEAADELQEHLSYQAQRAGADGKRWRIAVVDHAELMSMAAANRLLKILEEPPAEALLILMTAHPQRLPVTVRSRLIKLRICPPSADQSLAWLQMRAESEGLQFSRDQIRDILSVNGYAPLAALEVLRNGGSILGRNWDEFFGANAPQTVLQLAEKWTRSDKRTIAQWVCEVELELNRCYRRYHGLGLTPGRADRWLSADALTKIRRSLQQARRLGVGSKIALNAQIFLESIGLAKFESPMEQ